MDAEPVVVIAEGRRTGGKEIHTSINAMHFRKNFSYLELSMS